MKSYYRENALVIACGMGNGDVMLVSQDASIDTVPRSEQENGKVTGIEMLKYGNRDYFVIFRENPGSLSIVRHSDEEIDFYQEYFTFLDENVSLVQMSSYDSCSVFLLTLNSNFLTISFYGGSNKLETLYMKEYNKEDLRSVVAFALPENSLFYNNKEFGCDLWMVSKGGSEIQSFTLTSSREESLIQEIIDGCIEKSIWQKHDLQTKIIREFSENGYMDFSEYEDEELKMLHLLVTENKSFLINDFLLRRIGNNYIFPNEDVNLIDC